MSQTRITRLLETASRALLAFDAFVDSSMFSARRTAFSALQTIDAASDRLHLSGGPRILVEFACEALTLGLAGLLVALTLAIPAFQETADDDWLTRGDLAVTFQDRYGIEVGKRGIKHDEAVPLEELPDFFVKAVLATEDRRFYSHFGIDVVGTIRALTVDAKASGVVQGGSSITQQLAKNLFLTNERSIERKIKEAYLALWLEFHVTKKEILKFYLDRAYMGAGSFGVEDGVETRDRKLGIEGQPRPDLRPRLLAAEVWPLFDACRARSPMSRIALVACGERPMTCGAAAAAT